MGRTPLLGSGDLCRLGRVARRFDKALVEEAARRLVGLRLDCWPDCWPDFQHLERYIILAGVETISTECAQRYIQLYDHSCY